MTESMENILKAYDAQVKICAQQQQQVMGCNAQIQAAKQMMGEQLETISILRTNLILFQQANQDLAQQNEKNKAALEKNKKDIEALVAERDMWIDKYADLEKSVSAPVESSAPESPEETVSHEEIEGLNHAD